MSELPYPSDLERLRQNVRSELATQRAMFDLKLDDSALERLADGIAAEIDYAFEVRWVPRWVKDGEPHRWTESDADGAERHFVDCPRCRTLSVHSSATEADLWWSDHLKAQHIQTDA